MEQKLIDIIHKTVLFKQLSEKQAYDIAENYIIALFLLKHAANRKERDDLIKVILQSFKHSLQTNTNVISNIEKLLTSFYRRFKRFEGVCNFFDKYKNTSFINNINQKHKIMRLSVMLLKKDLSKFS